jgi:hypothetical protein
VRICLSNHIQCSSYVIICTIDLTKDPCIVFPFLWSYVFLSLEFASTCLYTCIAVDYEHLMVPHTIALTLGFRNPLSTKLYHNHVHANRTATFETLANAMLAAAPSLQCRSADVISMSTHRHPVHANSWSILNCFVPYVPGQLNTAGWSIYTLFQWRVAATRDVRPLVIRHTRSFRWHIHIFRVYEMWIE